MRFWLDDSFLDSIVTSIKNKIHFLWIFTSVSLNYKIQNSLIMDDEVKPGKIINYAVKQKIALFWVCLPIFPIIFYNNYVYYFLVKAYHLNSLFFVWLPKYDIMIAFYVLNFLWIFLCYFFLFSSVWCFTYIFIFILHPPTYFQFSTLYMFFTLNSIKLHYR